MQGYLRVAACVPEVRVANVKENIEKIRHQLSFLEKEAVQLVVFPELCVTAYTCADLFHNRELIRAAEDGLCRLMAATESLTMTYVVGVPVLRSGVMYNCAAVVAAGRLLGLVPKTYVPNYNEFYEKRWWAGAPSVTDTMTYAGQETTFGTAQIFNVGSALVGVEICEDLWTALPPSTVACLAGAEVIVNLSASDALIGKRTYIEELVKQQSARTLSGYVYASAGFGESSTDLVFDGMAFVAENGNMLGQNTPWTMTRQCVIRDIDLEALRRDRMHVSSFADTARRNGVDVSDYVVTVSPTPSAEVSDLRRHVNPHPFVPADEDNLSRRCREIINIQVAGLCQRLNAIRCRSAVIGISGGLDSTLALLVTAQAFDRLGLDRKNITGVTMPGFGTTDRTHTNAVDLMTQLGVSIRQISINKAVAQHFEDIGHDPSVHDVTYENSQARERTQILMDVANQTGGIVIGTGDLSELALGWATYNGDHMSMYGVNASVPKTLVRYLVRAFAAIAAEEGDNARHDTLIDIVDTPVSPELIPADKDGRIVQKTEDLVGPYELHDFFLYYMLRYGFDTERIYGLALIAFDGRYDAEVIKHWLTIFMRRFFGQQFKRSCLPDGPKVGSVCLSPRGDWRMPSDACPALWQQGI